MTEKYDFDRKLSEVREAVIDAMLPEIVFEGWSNMAFEHAIEASGVDKNHARLAFPKGAIDVAIAFHRQGDAQLADWISEFTVGDKISQRIERAVIRRLEIANTHKEAVRAASALFTLPQNATTGSKLIWGTADTIWNAIGDDARGFDFYSKRSSLSAVYSSSLLYWLQDEDPNMTATRAFVGRRIQDVLRFGKFTSQLKRPFQRST